MRLISKQGDQYSISGSLLVLFSTPFIVWQMGVLFFSGTTMSLFGRTPIPLTKADTSLVIAAGYIASIIAICLIPRKIVWVERIVTPAALFATLMMLFPFSQEAITALFYISAFCCVFSIGAMMSVATQHFTVETTWRDGIISMVAGGAIIAVLQNDFIKADFTVFTILSVLLIAMQTVFYYLIPAKIEVPYANRDSGDKTVLFAGAWLINGFSTLLVCFASSYAESTANGVSVLYLSAAAMAVLLYRLRKKGGSRVFGIFFAVAVFGFVLAYLSMQLPALRLAACVFLSPVVVLGNLWIFFGAVAFRAYPTRFIGAIGAGMGLGLALFHSGLLTLLRDNTALLYGVYAALSVALLLIYYFMEPYFTHERNKAQKRAADAAAPEPLPDEDDKKPLEPFAGLSEQERALANLILDGYTETSAAKRMNITLNTQKGYRKNLYAKLEIHSKRELFELVNESK